MEETHKKFEGKKKTEELYEWRLGGKKTLHLGIVSPKCHRFEELENCTEFSNGATRPSLQHPFLLLSSKARVALDVREGPAYCCPTTQQEASYCC
jgi:hypothetical protein